MRILLCLLWILALASGPEAATYHLVPGGGDFPTIQEAIDACVDGDSILLADGTYTFEDPLGLIFWGRDIFFGSESNSPADCVIDVGYWGGGEKYGYGFNLSQGESRACVVQGLTICDATGEFGGAFHIRASSPIVRNCIIRDNWASVGGAGVYARENSNALIIDCHIFANRSWILGSAGAGVKTQGSVEIVNCVIEHNVVGGPGFSGLGGGIYSVGAGLIKDCIIRDNFGGEYGGGIAISGGGRIENCLIHDNWAEIAGGGIAAWTVPWAQVDIVNCSIVRNEASDGSALRNSNYLTGYGGGPVVLSGCIAALNSGPGEAFLSELAGATFTLSCSDVWGNPGGDWTGPIAGQLELAGNLNVDPLFCDAEGGEFTLNEASPCMPEHNDCGVLIGALGMGCTLTAVPGESPAPLPQLAQNHPNPFNARTSIVFSLPAAGPVDLRLYDPAGRERAALLAGAWLEAGTQRLDWDGRDGEGRALPSGVYLYRLTTPWGSLSRKLTLLQ